MIIKTHTKSENVWVMVCKKILNSKSDWNWETGRNTLYYSVTHSVKMNKWGLSKFNLTAVKFNRLPNGMHDLILLTSVQCDMNWGLKQLK